MRISSLGINGYNAALVGRFGIGDVGKYGFALSGIGDTCFEYDSNGVCLSTTSDGGATVQPCTTPSGDTIASAACGSAGVNQQANCTAAGGAWANNVCVYPPGVIGSVSMTTAAIWLACAVGVIFLVR
jgi:hypothetical protein